MRVVNGANNFDVILKAYGLVMKAPQVTIREQQCREVRNVALLFDGRLPPMSSFRDRNMNLDYMKREWLWYLGADPMDDSIMEHAKMWQKLKQPDGSFYSNYGQYIFARNEQGDSPFKYVIKTLQKDPRSRRASIVLLQPHHLFEENTDTVCTYAINFSIEDNVLNMTVMMRSNDIVFGLTNDAFCFWNLMEFVYAVLARSIPGLQRGTYTHFTNSLHVYDHHYEMLRRILLHPNGNYYTVDVPRPTPEEVVEIVNSNGKSGSGAYYEWLTSFNR